MKERGRKAKIQKFQNTIKLVEISIICERTKSKSQTIKLSKNELQEPGNIRSLFKRTSGFKLINKIIFNLI